MSPHKWMFLTKGRRKKIQERSLAIYKHQNRKERWDNLIENIIKMNFICGFILAAVIFDLASVKGQSIHSEIKEKISTNFMVNSSNLFVS